MSTKINIKIVFWEIVILFFAFQRVLVNWFDFFSYLDEIFGIAIMLSIAITGFKKGNLFNKSEFLILFGWLMVVVIGIIGNIKSGLLNNTTAIIIDIISMIKVWLAYYSIITTNKNLEFYDLLIKKVAQKIRLLVWIMFFCMILSRVINLGMLSEVRYGIASFKFLFDVPGNYSKLFYFIIPLLTADLYYKNTYYKKIVLGMSLIIWISTMRSRAIAFSVMYLLLVIIFFCGKNREKINNLKKKIKIRYLIPIIVIAVVLSWNQIIFYFTTSTQARSVLLRYGIETMKDYFPLGSGFGTYGSDIASKYYSDLYIKYGFNSFYGMRENERLFLNDNYWPMVIGQFGLWGTLIIGIIIFKFMKVILKDTGNNKYFYFSAFCGILFLLLSSAASKSYAEYSSICIFMLLGLLVKRERKQAQISNKEEEKKE